MSNQKIKYINEYNGRCLLCNATGSLTAHTHGRDALISGDIFHIQACTICGHLLTNPRPRQEDIHLFYSSGSYISHQDKPRTYRDRIYMLARTVMSSRKVNVVKRWVDKSRIFVDIGCGTGAFLTSLHKAGYRVAGVEPAQIARNTASSKGFDVYESVKDLQVFEPGTIGGISLWHVLEHMYDVSAQMQNYHRLLGPGGHLFIAVPMWQSFDAAFYRHDWAAYDLPRHIHHFSQKTLVDLAGKSGFACVGRSMMPFDSFYVSLLSEQNRHAKIPALATPRALAIGTISNLMAMLRLRPASSMLFVFQKI